MKRPSSLRHPGRVALLVLAASALNLVPIPLPGETRLFLGPFVYMPLVLTLPLPWAVLAAAVPMAVTLLPLGHPFTFLLASLEALVLALGAQRWRRQALLHEGLFWAVAGLPLLGWLYFGVAHLPDDLVILTAAKQVFNQSAAVGLAVFLLRNSRLGAWLEERSIPRRRVRDMVFHQVFVLALVPVVLVGIGVSILLRAYAGREDREVLLGTGQRLSQQLDLFFQLHQAAVATAAQVLSREGANPGILIEEMRRTHPGFVTMLVTDAQGVVTHAAPSAVLDRARGTTVADRDYFIKARDLGGTYTSGVFRGRGFGSDILVAISAPLRDRSGRFAGVVEASLEVHNVARLIVGPPNADGIEFTLVDRAGRVIYSSVGAGLAPLVRIQDHPQAVALAREGDDQPRRFDQRNSAGDNQRFSAFLTRSPTTGVAVIAQRPLLAGMDGSGWVYLLFGAVAASIMGAAAWVAHSARQKAAVPLEYFAVAASRQAALRQVEPITQRFPSAPYEVVMVFRAFNYLAAQVQRSYAMLRETNADLDRRVIERTAEADAARRQAEAANQSKTDFLAMTSHEIRTPLNAIIGLADSLVDTVQTPVVAERLRTIRVSGHRLLGVVNDLLDLSRVEAGKLELRLAAVELGALCGEVRDLFVVGARQRGLQLDLELPPELPLWVETDRLRLQQVLINLVGNALNFTKAGRVRLRVECEEATAAGVRLRFAVIDTGAGIPADQQARLFQPYSQLSGGAQSSVPGTGLGLFISRRLVGLFGGTLSLRSETGCGAEFHFTLEMTRCAIPAATLAPAAAAPVSRRTRLRVLAADDNIANREVLRSMLEAQCARLEVVEGAADAVAALARESFDVALVDLEMPGGDGFSVAQAVRAGAAGEAARTARLIAISAHSRQQVWARCEAEGFAGFVEKPIDRRELLRVLDSVAEDILGPG